MAEKPQKNGKESCEKGLAKQRKHILSLAKKSFKNRVNIKRKREGWNLCFYISSTIRAKRWLRCWREIPTLSDDNFAATMSNKLNFPIPDITKFILQTLQIIIYTIYRHYSDRSSRSTAPENSYSWLKYGTAGHELHHLILIGTL